MDIRYVTDRKQERRKKEKTKGKGIERTCDLDWRRLLQFFSSISKIVDGAGVVKLVFMETVVGMPLAGVVVLNFSNFLFLLDSMLSGGRGLQSSMLASISRFERMGRLLRIIKLGELSLPYFQISTPRKGSNWVQLEPYIFLAG